jgi:hypothetical protein
MKQNSWLLIFTGWFLFIARVKCLTLEQVEALVKEQSVLIKQHDQVRYYNTERRQLKFKMAQGRKFRTF